MEIEQRKIIFYDGDCGFCNRSVQFVLQNERSPLLYFAALQSDFARKFFAQHQLPEPDMSTFYFWDQSMYAKSTGALRVLGYLRFPLSVGRFFRWIPRPLRDAIYDVIAQRRQRLAGNFCALPTEDQRKRFLS